MIKKNWKFKKVINLLFYRVREYPKTLKTLTKITWFVRYILRGCRHPAQDKAGGVLINEGYNLLHAANPKVASSSIKKYFQDSIRNSDIYITKSVQELESLTNKKLNDYYSFAVVRNSYNRAYSCWLDKISNNNKFADIFIITRYRYLYPDMPFEDFVDWLCNSEEGSDEYADRHWISQRILLGMDQDVEYDKVIWIENLNQDFSKIAFELNLPNSFIATSNSSGVSKSPEFNSMTIAQLAKRYASDIECFKFNSPEIKKEA